MVEKVIHKCDLHDLSSDKADLAYWLSRPAEERIAAVDHLRKQFNGNRERLQRVVRVIQRADLEALGEE